MKRFAPETVDCGMLALAAVLVAVVLWPFQNAPFIDDWVYAWPVQHLIETGELRIPEYSSNPNLSQILWAAAFCLPFGFSFTALRISTWTLAVTSLWALYLLLRDFGVPRQRALLGAAVVGAYPLYFVLSATFMTDVPFVAAMLWSVLLFTRALNRRRPALVWIAALICCAAAAVRVIGIGIAGAMFVTLLLHTGRWGRRPSLLIASVLALPSTWALLAWSRSHTFVSADMTWVSNAPANRLQALQYAWPLLPQMLVVTLMFVVALLGFALLPLAIGAFERQRARRVGLLMAALVVIWLVGTYAGLEFWIPLAPGQTWAIDELGATTALVPEWQSAVPFPRWAGWATTAIGLGLGAVILAELPVRRLREHEMFILWVIAGQFVLAAVLWLFYDRYGLVFVPLAVVLFLARQPSLRLRPAVAGLFVYGVLSIVGTRDHLAYSRALWSGVAELRAQGVPVSDIDGGYVVNGWLQYLHPEQAHRAPDGRIAIPWVNDDAQLAYTVANRPRGGATIVRTIPYAGWLRRVASDEQDFALADPLSAIEVMRTHATLCPSSNIARRCANEHSRVTNR